MTLTGVTQLKIGDVCWRASVVSEKFTGVTQLRFRYIYRRASVASEILTGVTQSKIGAVCLSASKRDTYRGNTIENRRCLFIYLFVYMYGRMYVI